VHHSPVGYNFSLLLIWLAGLLWALRAIALSASNAATNEHYDNQSNCSTDDLIASTEVVPENWTGW
jgi:hypothetical protein